MTARIKIDALTATGFAPFGEVIEARAKPDKIINQGQCERHHNLAKLSFIKGQAGISLFRSKAINLPYTLDMMERHPDGSQAFLPLSEHLFLVIAAPDNNNKPGHPAAFLSAPGQGVNYHPNVWHAPLCPLHENSLFGVIDRIGEGDNLEEFWFKTPYWVDK